MAYQELYNYTGKNAVKMAGTLTQFSIDNGTNWLDLQGFQEIGTVGTKANTIDQSTIEDQTKRFISGIKEGEDKELEMLWYDGDTSQETLRTKANEGAIVKFRHQFKTGDIATYEATLLGFQVSSGTNEDLMKFTVSMKLNGDPTWSKATVIPAQQGQQGQQGDGQQGQQGQQGDGNTQQGGGS